MKEVGERDNEWEETQRWRIEGERGDVVKVGLV